jgi:osmotically-inducible protein OsmY
MKTATPWRAVAAALTMACTPAVQQRALESTDPGDVRLTTVLREELIAEPRLSFVSRSIEIGAHQRRVTLHGTVTREEHDLIIDRAQAVAGAERVVDQLEVK